MIYFAKQRWLSKTIKVNECMPAKVVNIIEQIPWVRGAFDGLLAVLSPGPRIGRWIRLSFALRSIHVTDRYRHHPLLHLPPTYGAMNVNLSTFNSPIPMTKKKYKEKKKQTFS